MENILSTVLLDPSPRKKEDIFTPAALLELSAVHQLIEFDGSNRANFYSKHIGDADFIIGHPDLDTFLLKHAKKLKAVFNVEGNFTPNIDYQFCFGRGIRVLTPSSVFSVPVAEIAIGMLLSLARGIHSAHGDFVKGKELYGLEGNTES